MEPDEALSKMGKEQLRDDITHHSGEYAEFVATKVGRIWSHGPRAIMRTPVWEALHWVLLGLGLLGLGAPRLPAPLGGPVDRRGLPRRHR